MKSDSKFANRSTAGVQGLKPYVPGKPVSALERELGITESIKLASNENPLGASPKAKGVIHGALEDLSRYPDGGGYDLREALAQRHNVDINCITLGNGSNDVLDIIARVFLGPGKEAVFSQYAFAVYPIVTQAVGAVSKIAPAIDYGHDLDTMLSLVNENTRVIFIANPNNPTGTWVNAIDLKAFLEQVQDNIVVVVDEAYIEYVTDRDYPDTSLWLSEFDNLIVTRTFSKAYGLAALRVGYCISHADVANLLNRVRQPFNVNTLAQLSALAALDDQNHIQQSVLLNTQQMAYYETELKRLGLGWIPSVGNFITVDLEQDATEIDRLLLHEGVITRPVANYNMPNHLRISIGLKHENERCIAALEKVLNHNA